MEREEAINAVSGAVAGLVTAVFVCPLDVLKTRLQVTKASSTSISGGIRAIIAHEGVSGMYKGLGPTLLALLPNWAVYFVVYDSLKRRLGAPPPSDGGGGGAAAAGGGATSPLTHMAAAAGAGVTTILVTNPLWVVKTRMQCHGMLAASTDGTAAAAGRVGAAAAAAGATAGAGALRPEAPWEGAVGLRPAAAAAAVPPPHPPHDRHQPHPSDSDPHPGRDGRASCSSSSNSSQQTSQGSSGGSCSGGGGSGGGGGGGGSGGGGRPQARGLGPGPPGTSLPGHRASATASATATSAAAAAASHSKPAAAAAAAAKSGAPSLAMSGASTAVAPYLQRPPYKSTAEALIRIAREEGLRGLYSGLAPSMAGIAHVAIQFPLYEYAKQAVASHKAQQAAEAAGGDAAEAAEAAGAATTDCLTVPELVATSAFAKVVASTVTYPHEVVRSYMHLSGSGPLSGLREAVGAVWREDGLRGFYRGCAANLVRTTPAAAMTFTTFELVSRALREAM